MGTRRTIALIIGAVVTIVTFGIAMAMVILGGFVEEKHLIVYASVALAPILMLSVMVGYAVWWLVMFLLTLLLPDSGRNTGK